MASQASLRLFQLKFGKKYVENSPHKQSSKQYNFTDPDKGCPEAWLPVFAGYVVVNFTAVFRSIVLV